VNEGLYTDVGGWNPCNGPMGCRAKFTADGREMDREGSHYKQD